MLLPPLVLGLLLSSVLGVVVAPTWRARPGSLLAGTRGRAVATAAIVLLLVLAALWLADADAERMRAAAKPIGPGWDPDAGIAEEARAGFLGLLGALVGAPYVAVALLFDVLALRRLGRAALAPSGVVDVGLGDEIVERPRAADYRSDASPDVAKRRLAEGDARGCCRTPR